MTAAYFQTFAQIHLTVTFTIGELLVASDRVAYALTQSHGIQTTLATGAESAVSNREVFSFAPEGGDWKIARYLFKQAERATATITATCTHPAS